MDQAQHENAQRIIDDLFGKLRQAEMQTGARDSAAERQIAAAVERQPAAPYYMAQAMLVQERAIETLHQRVQELEQALASKPAGGGGFLDSLFGTPAARAAGNPATAPGASQLGQSTNPAMAARMSQMNRPGGGFLGSALQTAAAVAGGVMLANLLTGLFTPDEAQAAEAPPAEDPGLEPQFDEQMMDDGDMGDFDGFDDF